MFGRIFIVFLYVYFCTWSPSFASSQPPCSKANTMDHYVLAIEWFPSFCLSNPDNESCKKKSENPVSYASEHLSLHGLWPNRSDCGTGYAFCGGEMPNVKSMCDLPALPFSDSSFINLLSEYMPGVLACLQRYEWIKHGTCQSFVPQAYFEEAIDLVKQVNTSYFGRYISRNINTTISLSNLYDAFDHDLGDGARNSLSITCSENKVTDIWVSLKKNFNVNKPFSDNLLILSESAISSCPSKVLFPSFRSPNL